MKKVIPVGSFKRAMADAGATAANLNREVERLFHILEWNQDRKREGKSAFQHPKKRCDAEVGLRPSTDAPPPHAVSLHVAQLPSATVLGCRLVLTTLHPVPLGTYARDPLDGWYDALYVAGCPVLGQ